MPTELRRVEPSGLRGRAVRVGLTTALWGVAALVAAFAPTDTPIPVRIVGLTSSALLLWLWIRLGRVGVWTSSDELVARSWWRTRRWKRDEVTRASAEVYEGLLWLFGLQIVEGTWQSGILRIELANGKRVTLHGSISDLYTTRRTSQALNRWIGSEVGAGTGERQRAQQRLRAERQD